MPLLDLANELLLCIAENLESERDINAFTRTSPLPLLSPKWLSLPTQQAKYNKSALLWAATRGREATVQKLIAEGANFEVMVLYYKRKRALKIAAKNGHLAVVKLLLEAKADVNVKYNDGWT